MIFPISLFRLNLKTIYRTTWSGNDYRENKDFVNSLISKTSSDGKGIISLNPDDTKEAGSYFVEIKAKDEKSKCVTAGHIFYVSDGRYEVVL